ncbi:MAG TPA: glycosyltransferase [Nitrospiraceae bacterium]|nr:glycosyltransferase [Nitrospiraceae bacterium]
MNMFESNLAAIALKDPALVTAIREARGGAFHITPARNGQPTAMVSGRSLHSAYDPWREAEAWATAQAAVCRAGEVLIVLGVGLLYHVEALRACVSRDTTIGVIVPDLNEFHDVCMVRALDRWMNEVEWLWGPVERIAASLATMGRPLRFLSYTPAAALHASMHADLDRLIRQQVSARAGGQVHVAVVGPIYGGSLPIAKYAAAALEQLGHRVTWIDHSLHHASYDVLTGLKDPRHRATLQSRFADLLGQLTIARIAEDPPDVVLALAQAPMTLPLLEHMRKKNFMTVMWFVENYRHLTYWQQVAAGYDHWFVIQKQPCEDALRYAGAKQVNYLPMAAEPSIHCPLPLTPEDQTALGADVSCVGAGYANRRDLLPRLLTKEWVFKLWGNEWDGVTSLADVLQRGGTRIDSDTCVKVFNGTKVNINLHSWTGEGLDPDGDFVNPRTFELAACGAFQIVDDRTLLPEVFTTEQILTFRRPDDLVPLVRQWLRDEVGRRHMANAARQRVLAEHTYGHRMRQLLAQIGVSQPDRVGAILHGQRQASALMGRSEPVPELIPVLAQFAAQERVELKDVALRIRERGMTDVLSREDLLILMLDEYRMETRDLL